MTAALPCDSVELDTDHPLWQVTWPESRIKALSLYQVVDGPLDGMPVLKFDTADGDEIVNVLTGGPLNGLAAALLHLMTGANPGETIELDMLKGEMEMHQ